MKEFEQFADLLDVAVLKMREAGRDAELGNGLLYTNMLKKLTTTLLRSTNDGLWNIFYQSPWRRFFAG